VTTLSDRLSSVASWEDFVKDHRGKSYLAPDIDHIHHSARGLLQDFRDKGVPVPMDDPPWAPEAIDQCAERGPHPSANLHREFLRDEMADFIDAGFWVVLPLDQVRGLGKDFRLSPVAVKEEVNRRPRVIVDHTWFGVNAHTVGELPAEVMQFGGALSRILWLLRHADPSQGPVYLAKFDISDGFYRMFLRPEDTLKLSVLMPRYEGEPQLVAVPLSTTMGWVSSPPTFCTASETVADLANASLYKNTVPPHRLEDTASVHDCWESPQPINNGEEPLFPDTGGPPASLSPQADDSIVTRPRPLPQPENRTPLSILPGPVAHVDVFVDDFIGLAQGSRRRCRNIRRCIMHAVDQVFSQRDSDAAQRKEAISEKKLDKGDGGWSQRKEILGWQLDSNRGTLELTPR
jgi:hypothetical protein